VDIAIGDHRAVIDFCLRHSIGFVVVGPEAPLVAGLGDNLRTMGIAVFGPNKAAAQLEGSKGFTKDLCAREKIPTAGYVRCREPRPARSRRWRISACRW
jgi:phosphoribosylamine--glycine ligase